MRHAPSMTRATVQLGDMNLVCTGQPVASPTAFSFFQRNALSAVSSVSPPLADHETADSRTEYIAPRYTFARNPALGVRSINPLTRIRSLLTWERVLDAGGYAGCVPIPSRGFVLF